MWWYEMSCEKLSIFVVALILVLSFLALHHFASIAQLYRRVLYRLVC